MHLRACPGLVTHPIYQGHTAYCTLRKEGCVQRYGALMPFAYASIACIDTTLDTQQVGCHEHTPEVPTCMTWDHLTCAASTHTLCLHPPVTTESRPCERVLLVSLGRLFFLLRFVPVEKQPCPATLQEGDPYPEGLGFSKPKPKPKPLQDLCLLKNSLALQPCRRATPTRSGRRTRRCRPGSARRTSAWRPRRPSAPRATCCLRRRACSWTVS